jgi:radical SAM superfamily enzyme
MFRRVDITKFNTYHHIQCRTYAHIQPLRALYEVILTKYRGEQEGAGILDGNLILE